MALCLGVSGQLCILDALLLEKEAPVSTDRSLYGLQYPVWMSYRQDIPLIPATKLS